MKEAGPAPAAGGCGGGFTRTVDALRVGDLAAGAQGVVVLLVAHQRVHPQDGCGRREPGHTFIPPLNAQTLRNSGSCSQS